MGSDDRGGELGSNVMMYHCNLIIEDIHLYTEKTITNMSRLRRCDVCWIVF